MWECAHRSIDPRLGSGKPGVRLQDRFGGTSVKAAGLRGPSIELEVDALILDYQPVDLLQGLGELIQLQEIDAFEAPIPY